MLNTTQFEFIKADEGWFVLTPFYDNGVIIRAYREQVIAWKIEHIIGKTTCNTAVMVFPVTPSGIQEDFVLQTPDGLLYIPDEQDFKDENSVIDYFENVENMREAAQKLRDDAKTGASKG